MKDERDTCSTPGSSLSGVYKNFFKSQTPVCMFYFSHPFGISTPSSANNGSNIGEKKKPRKGSKYTTTTYLVTEIQKNHSDGSQDECEVKKNTHEYSERELLPWPRNFLLPPLLQLIEKKHGKLPDIDAILKQVRKQAWNTPKSHHSHSFWSRGSTVSSDDFSSLTSPDSLNNKSFTSKAKLKRKYKSTYKAQKMEPNEISCGSGNNNGNSHGKLPSAKNFYKRRFSVPEIIMRKYSLAQQKCYEESSSVYSPTSETITKRNGQNTINNNKRPILLQTPPSSSGVTSAAKTSPIKYFIPLSPQSTLASSTTPYGGSGGFLHNNNNSSSSNGNTNEISMRKQTLLRRMWSREHSKYSGSWSPPLRKSTQQSRLKKFNTLPEFISSSCEKCKELGVLARDSSINFNENLCCNNSSIDENKEDKSQQTDFNYDASINLDKQHHNLSSASSSASTIIHSSDILKDEVIKKELGADESSMKVQSSSSKIDSNGNNIIICMTALQESSHSQKLNDISSITTKSSTEEMLQVEIDGNNNTDLRSENNAAKNGDKCLKKQFSTQLEDEGYHPSDELTNIHYHRLREEKLSEVEIDQYISQMLIDNLNNVIKTVNENLQANGEHNLVKIDYSTSEVAGHDNYVENEDVGNGCEGGENGVLYNNKLRNSQQHENAIQMRNAKNGDNKNRNSNESTTMSPTNYIPAVERDICENADVNTQKLRQEEYHRNYLPSYKSVSDSSTDSSERQLHQQLEVTAIISTGTSYPRNLNRPETILVPRIIGPKTESMEVNPSSSSAQDDDEFDGMPDSDDEDISDVDSLDDVVTIKAKKLNELAHQQHKKAQSLFRQTHLKGQAFFVPIVDTEQPIDEHIVVADTMPEKLKERLVLRQRRRDLKKQSEMKIKQWQMQKFIERKMEQMNVVSDYLADLSTTGGAFKIIGMPSKQTPIETNVYRRSSDKSSGGGGMGIGWVPKQRNPSLSSGMNQSSNNISSISTSEKSSKSKKLRNEIGMLESYKIDARGNMQIQQPKSSTVEKPIKPRIKRTSYTSVSEGKKSNSRGSKFIKTPSEITSRKSVASSKQRLIASSNVPTSSASSHEAVDVRRRQVIKDVQQMSVYKNDLTPDPDSGPSRKMWKTEIQEGDKHIEILEIVECVDGNTLAQQAPEHNINNNFINHHHLNTPQNHHNKFYHVPSSSMFVNKTFSVKASGFDDSSGRHYASRIPVPVYHRQRYRQPPFIHYDPRDSSPSNHQSSSTEAEDSLTSAGSRSSSSKVDRMIANLLMEALKSPEDLGIEFIKSPKIRRIKRRSQSPAGADSSSTGYFTGDSSSRRSASNSAGKYQHRFEVIPEEKSSFSVDSSNDDFIEGEEEDDDEMNNARNEKINSINSDWKSKKNLQNNDIKTRTILPQQQNEKTKIDDVDEVKEEKENEEELEKTGKLQQKSSPFKVKSPSRIVNGNHLKTPSLTSSNKSTKSSPSKSPSKIIKSFKTTPSNYSLPEEKKKHEDKDSIVVAPSTPTSEIKSFMMFTEDDNGNEDENININNCTADDNGSLITQKTEATFHSDHCSNNRNHHLMINDHYNNSKNPSSCSSSTATTNTTANHNSSSNNNNYYHYHLYQYQTNHCCFNLLDHSISSSTVTTAASTSNVVDNFSMANSYLQGVTDITVNTPMAYKNDDNKLSTVPQFESNENPTALNSSSSEFPSTVYGLQSNSKFNCASSTPLCDETISRLQTASDEKIIEIENSTETFRKPQEHHEDHSIANDDNCSCRKKYVPYKINEKNVWQVYETSDCKYIHSKVEIDEAFQPPTTSDSTIASENCNFLHSRSNFSNQIVCHAINHEMNHRNENAQSSLNSTDNKPKADYVNNISTQNISNIIDDSLYTPTFNIKPANFDTCQCISFGNITENNSEIVKSVVKINDNDVNVADNDENYSEDDEKGSITLNKKSISIQPVAGGSMQMGKLLNRPKATNKISRDQVKPVEKEIENEITHNGSVKHNNNSFKTASKPIRLPSPVSKAQQQRISTPKRNNSYEDNSNSSNESSIETDQSESPKRERSRNSRQKSVESVQKGKSRMKRENSLVKQEGKNIAIPNIHQGWSVTVAGTHPDLAPDVEMKISFPKAKGSSQSASIIHSESSEVQKPDPEVYYYKNNQLLPAPNINHLPPSNMAYEHKPYYNNRRSLSLARIDSGMSGMVKPKSNLPYLHIPRPTARPFKQQVQCTTISSSKTFIPSRRSLSLDVGNRRMSYDSRSQISPCTPSEMLSVVGSEIKKTLKPKVKTQSERDLTKRHLNCFTRNNGPLF